MNNLEALHKYIQKVANKIINDGSSKTVLSGVIFSSLPGCYEVRLIGGGEESLIRAYSVYEDIFSTSPGIYRGCVAQCPC